jgi:hypothetical protein
VDGGSRIRRPSKYFAFTVHSSYFVTYQQA